MRDPAEEATSLPLDEINPGSFDFWLRDDVHGALAKLRRERPVAWHQHPDSGKGFWSLTRYADVAAATRDWETFTSAFGIQVMTDFQGLSRIRSMITADPPRHTKLRNLVNRGFTPKVIAGAEASIRRRARAIVDAIAPRGEVEFVSEVAAVLPVQIICDTMGVPEADRPRVLALSQRFLAAGDPEYAATRAALLRAGEELNEYGLSLGRDRLAHPQEDLATLLVHAEVDGERLSPQDLGSFFVLLVSAGIETTRNAISHGLWALTRFPGEKARWLADVEGQAAAAAEEIVRWSSPVLHMRRTLTRDAEFAGVDMQKGDKVALWYVSANRDDARFADPQRFDIGRALEEHGGFGTGGPHFCLGAHLARREIGAMLAELLHRLPDIEATAPPEKLRSNFVNGIKRLPAAFTPRQH